MLQSRLYIRGRVCLGFAVLAFLVTGCQEEVPSADKSVPPVIEVLAPIDTPTLESNEEIETITESETEIKSPTPPTVPLEDAERSADREEDPLPMSVDEARERLAEVVTPKILPDKLNQDNEKIVAWLESVEIWFIEVVSITRGQPFTHETKQLMSDRLMELFDEPLATQILDYYLVPADEEELYTVRGTDVNLGIDASAEYEVKKKQESGHVIIQLLVEDQTVHKSRYVEGVEKGGIVQFLTSAL